MDATSDYVDDYVDRDRHSCEKQQISFTLQSVYDRYCLYLFE